MQDLSTLVGVATSVILPLFGYLIIRRDKQMERHTDMIDAMRLAAVEAKGEIRGLQTIATMMTNNVTRAEFENGMRAVKDTLQEIKDRLDNR